MTKPQALDALRQPFQIRKARIDDATSIAKLGAHMFTATFGHPVPPNELQAYLNKDYTTAAITKELEDPTKTS